MKGLLWTLWAACVGFTVFCVLDHAPAWEIGLNVACDLVLLVSLWRSRS